MGIEMSLSVVLEMVLPGQMVTSHIEERISASKHQAKRLATDASPPTIKLGHGLLQVDDQIISCRAGSLLYQAPNKFYVLGPQKRYIPAVGDLVVGIITSKLSELYRVDIGCHMNAALPLANFEGTTRKNKPNLNVGSVVFARVLVANKDLEPELICMDENGKGDGFGEVKEGGMLNRCSVSYSQQLQKAVCPILDALAKHFAFEIVAGANGRFVINGASVADTVALSKAILAAENLESSQIPALIKETMTNRQS